MAGTAPQRVERLEVTATGDVLLFALQLLASLLLPYLTAQVVQMAGLLESVLEEKKKGDVQMCIDSRNWLDATERG